MRHLSLILLLFFAISAFAQVVPEGSHRRYPVPDTVAPAPAGLTPFYISHVGRHGSRYPSSGSTALQLKNALVKADTAGTITRAGRQLLALVEATMEQCQGRWGALDSIGIEEQRGLASRMFDRYRPAFAPGATVEAIASHSPRAVLSMYSFAHQMAQLSSRLEINTRQGERYSPLLRPYDSNEPYILYRSGKQWCEAFDSYFQATAPASVARRLVGSSESDEQLQQMAYTVYSFIASLPAMGIDIDHTAYLTDEEYELLWTIANLRHYLLYCGNTLSAAPAQLAIPLVEEIVRDADRVVEGRINVAAHLRFGHAETLMPLLSLLQVEGCFYLTHYFDQVQQHWRDYEIVPMAANLQFIFFHDEKGDVLVRTDLNERPVHLIPGNPALYLPWDEVRSYLLGFTFVIE